MWEYGSTPSLSQRGVRKKRGIKRWRESRIPDNLIIGNYRFLDLIGVGGFGEVYRAESLEVYREVAIKLYVTDDSEALRAFRRGANYLAQLDHPNIIKMFDFFTVDQWAMMVMELLSPDQTLRRSVGDFCNQQRISNFVDIFLDVLSAVRYCHQKRFRDVDGDPKLGIYHGDIKPDNIFFHNGRVKVADFMIPNLERFLRSRRRDETFPYHDTRFYGTPMYMSPEQDSGIVNEQTDIYNIGVTAFELLTGFYPYDSEADYYSNTCQSPAKYCPHSPEWLNTILMRCVNNDVSQRYSHIAEIERDIIGGASGMTSMSLERVATNVLVVFANPRGSDPLRLGAEDRVIRECIKLSKHRDSINLNVLHAATIHDVRRTLLEGEYRIIHFSGHGTGRGLAFENEIGQVHIVPPDALAEFLTVYSPPVECVILNACYTKSQGQMLSLGVPFTIATEGPISDSGASEFTRGFYDAIGAGKSMEFAHGEGCRTMKLTGHQASDLPVILRKQE